MKSGRKLVATVLLLAMLVSLFSGVTFAAEPSVVMAERELAFEPLAQEASVAYERHENGYEVALTRETSAVTMTMYGPADAGARTPEGARLYVRTGVTPRQGVTYRVSFALEADYILPEYAVCLDGDSGELAYGALTGRSVEAGGTDRISHVFTPETDGGELVLRLLVGGCAGNVLRLSDLAVEEAADAAPGQSVVLVDRLNYAAPGSVSMWAHDDYKASLSTEKDSATLTVTGVPQTGAEVWKVQMKVATGVKPEPGKAYRIRADVTSTAVRKYEVCYNDGNVEKGYDVLYEQELRNGTLTLDRLIYASRDKNNPGELILQLSLGLLSVGDAVTVSNVRVEEAVAEFTNVLDTDFSFNGSRSEKSYEITSSTFHSTIPQTTYINWAGKTIITKVGDHAGELVVDDTADTAALTVSGGTEIWHAMLHINTGETLTKGTAYRASFTVLSDLDYGEYQVQYGTALSLSGWDNNEKYGKQDDTLTANTARTVTQLLLPDEDGGLVISLRLGKTGEGNTAHVTVSDIKLETLTAGIPDEANSAEVTYPGSSGSPAPVSGSFRIIHDDGFGGSLEGDGSAITLTASGSSGEVWNRRLVTDGICTLPVGSFKISFDIMATASTDFEVCYNRDEHFGDGKEKGFGAEYGLNAGADWQTVEHTVDVTSGGTLLLMVNLGKAAADTRITVKNVTVIPAGGAETNLASVTYPSNDGESASSFDILHDEGFGGSLAGDDSSVTLTAAGGSGEVWNRRLVTKQDAPLCTLTAGNSYKVSFDIKSTASTDFEVAYNKDEHFGDGKEKGFGAEYSQNAGTEWQTVEHTVDAADGGKLLLMVNLGKAAADTQITVKNVKVVLIGAETDIASVTYPTTPGDPDYGSFGVGDDGDGGHGGTLSVTDGSSVTMTCTGAGTEDVWRRRFFINDLCALSAGEAYEVSFQIKATASTDYEVSYGKDDHFGEGKEKGFGAEYGLNVDTDWQTVTHRVVAAESGSLYVMLNVGKAAENTQIAVKDVQVKKYEKGDNLVTPNYGAFHAENGVMNSDGTSATMTCSNAAGADWSRRLQYDALYPLTAGNIYQIDYDVQVTVGEAFNYSGSYGKDGHWGDSENFYAGGSGSLPWSRAETDPKTISRIVDCHDTGSLYLMLNVGEADENTQLTISNVGVYAMAPAGDNLANVTYPTAAASDPGSYAIINDDGYGGSLSGDGSSAILTATGGSGGVWLRRLVTKQDAPLCTLTAGNSYKVSFDITATASTDFEVAYNRDEHFGDGKEKGFGAEYGLNVGTEWKTVEHTVDLTSEGTGGKLLLMINLGAAAADTQITVKNVKVIQSGAETNLAAVTYSTAGTPTAGSFEIFSDPGCGASLAGDGSSATLTAADGSGEVWNRRLATKQDAPLCALASGNSYKISFDITATASTDFEVTYNRDEHFGDGKEKGFGAEYGLNVGAEWKTVEHTVDVTDGGNLLLMINLGKAAAGTEIAVKNIKVVLAEGDSNLAAVAYYPASDGGSGAVSNSFRVIHDDGYDGSLSGDGCSVTISCTGGSGGVWLRRLVADDICALDANTDYTVSYEIKANTETSYETCYNKNEHFGDGKEKGFGAEYGLTATAEWQTVEHTVNDPDGGKLYLMINLGSASGGTDISVRNVKVCRTGEADNLANVGYPQPVESSFDLGSTDGHAGSISGDGSSATLTCTGGSTDDVWKRKLFLNDICALTGGNGYRVSFDITASADTGYEVCYNNSPNGGGEKAFGALYGLNGTNLKQTVTYDVLAATNGKLSLQLNLGKAATGTAVTVSNITVKRFDLATGGTTPINDFGSVWGETPIEEYAGFVTRSGDSAVFTVTQAVSKEDEEKWKDWNARMFIRTGFTPAGAVFKANQVSFKIKAEKDQEKFHVLFNGTEDKAYGGVYNLSLKAGQETTVSYGLDPTGNVGELVIQLQLGLIDQTEGNTFTVSDVQINRTEYYNSGGTYVDVQSVDSKLQPGYDASVNRTKDSVSMVIEKTPDSWAEPWKNKMFVDTGVNAMGGQWYRVSMDVSAEKDMDYEVVYNRNDVEKGYDAIYGLHASAGAVRQVEKVFRADSSGLLKVQLSLGKVAAPNTVTVSNLSVEKIDFSYTGQSALPAPLSYRTPSDVTFWAHDDYAVTSVGSDSAVTMNILQAPEKGAEPWKIKLFLNTNTPLQAGKFYKVTTDLLAGKTQNVEICYNNGGAEMGYDSMGGIRLIGGETKTVEKIIGVPADKTDTAELMLQVNLGNTANPNEVTVSGVKVEEVSINYANKMSQGFTYQAGQNVLSWNTPDYQVSLVEAADKAAIRIDSVPAGDDAVWKVKLLVKTGAILAPGRSYLVHADLTAASGQGFEVCYNNEETEKGYDVLYGQYAQARTPVAIEKKITVPADMTDAGELILQFSVGGPVRNTIEVSNVSVQEMEFGDAAGKGNAPDTVVDLSHITGTAAGNGNVTRQGLSYHMSQISPYLGGNTVRVSGAALRGGDAYTVEFKAHADKNLQARFMLLSGDGAFTGIYELFTLTPQEQTYSFTTPYALEKSGAYELLWQFGSPEDQLLGEAQVELSDVAVWCPAELLTVQRSLQNVKVNGQEVAPAAYAINGHNYMKLRDLAVLLNGTDAQFVVRYNPDLNAVVITTGKEYTPIGGELVMGDDLSATCTRSAQTILVNGQPVKLKAYAIGGNNYFKLRDLDDILGFTVDYEADTNTVLITSPMTPERQEAAHGYQYFFRPEIDGESQPYVGDTMPFYEDGTYYIYYLKEGGDSFNHSVYLATTTDLVNYTEYDSPVLSASRADVQDSWIGTGSVVKAEGTYYFFYTGFNSSGSQEYHEKIMVAKGSTPFSFEKMSGWEITPPAELGQKNDFRDPQAYYDPDTRTFSLTVTASQSGVARILKYTLDLDLRNPQYDGIIFTDPTGYYWNLECSDTFRMGDKWYLTYSGQEDTLWYAVSDSRFGPYSAPVRMDGKVFYAAKHVENGDSTYMVGWARRSETASSVYEVSGWGGNLMVQKVTQRPDGSLVLTPVEGIVADLLANGTANAAADTALTASAEHSYEKAFTAGEYFLLQGSFVCPDSGTFGLAFDFNGKEDGYKLVALDPSAQKMGLFFNEGDTKIAEAAVELVPGQAYSFTFIQDGSVGIFYVDGQAALAVRLYGVSGRPICLFAENSAVTFTGLRQYSK